MNGRYRIDGPPIGQGGLGVVYKAYDTVTKRHVALKTTWGHVDPAALELFEREWTVLARLSHPNIVDILDTGEFQDSSQRKPYFVMPLLPGQTLDRLIRSPSERLSVERTVEIVAQVCRGLQAAHDQGLVHRDLKPSNIFVMDDDTVKIIDFGVVHLADTRSVTGIKGTLQYMSPEQIEMKPATQSSDVFSLGVVCYEALAGRKPFAKATEADTAEAIRRYVPPPVGDMNPAVNEPLSRTVHKAMAKQPWHRFSSAREFGDTLRKALRNEPIERFDRSKIQPRIDRIKKAYGDGDYQFAMEILSELESEGHLDPDMPVLRVQIEQALRQKTIRQLLDGARTRMEEEEYPLAVQKIQDVLDIDPQNGEALTLKQEIERQRSERQVDNWLRLARQHLENRLYGQARLCVQEVLKVTSDTKARQFLSEIDRQEQEALKVREEKQKIYESALDSYRNGEISTALSKLERVLELNRQGTKTATPDRDAQYQSLYNQIRSERDAARNAYAEGRKHLADENIARALEICEEFLQKHPGDPMFQALKIEAEEQQRQQQSAAIAEVNRRIEAEPDPERKYTIAKEAVEAYPNEPHFKSSLKLVRDRRDLIHSIVTRARQYEDRGQMNDAAGQWDILKSIYPVYPGLNFEMQRVARRREEHVREEAKARWVEQVDRHFAAGEHTRAQEAVADALREFPGDRELQGLATLAEQALKRSAEAGLLLDEARVSLAGGNFEEAVAQLRKAGRLDERNVAVRDSLLGALVERARSLVGSDWRGAEPFVKEALALQPGDPVARSLASLIEDYRRQDSVARLLIEARNLQAAGDLPAAVSKVEEGLIAYPNEVRLSQLQNTLRTAVSKSGSGAVASSAVQEPESPAPARENVSVPPAEPVITAGSGFSATVVLSAAPAGGFSEPPITPAAPPPQPAAPVRAKSKSPIFLGAAAAIVIAAIAVFLVLNHGSGHAPVPSALAVSFTANVPGATFTVDGQPARASLTLKPGSHTAVAAAAGYTPGAQTFTLNPQSAQPVKIAFALEPTLPELRISSDLKAGKLTIDNGDPIDLADGGATKDNIPTGDHTLKIFEGRKEIVSLAFRVEPKELPSLTSPLSNRGARAVVIASLGSSAKVYASPGMKAALGSGPLEPIAPSGLDLSGLRSANASLTIADGTAKPHELSIGAAALPVISVILNGASERIPLTVTANVPDAVVLVNGTPLKAPMANGSRIVTLPPGKYRIQVTHDGYTPPAEQIVEIKPGAENLQPLAFTLAPVVRYATLSVSGAPAQTEVWIDAKRAGEINASGTFTQQIPAGTHSVSLRKTNFEELAVTRDFKPNDTVRLSGNAVTPYGTLDLHITPAGAKITYLQEGAATQPGVAPANHAVPLPQGTYEITAEADRYVTKSATVKVVPGSATTLDWTLQAVAKPQVAATPASVFENGGAWAVQGGWWIHDANGWSFMRRRQGTFEIDILKESEKAFLHSRPKKVDFTADYIDQNNRVAYTLDGRGLTRRVFSGGHARRVVRVPLGMDSSSVYRLVVAIAPDSIAIKNVAGKTLDTVKTSGPLGKFGFQDEVKLVVR
ncbi:MAG: protein kinase domain-containing protein [Bryobacteraceae bacterium]